MMINIIQQRLSGLCIIFLKVSQVSWLPSFWSNFSRKVQRSPSSQKSPKFLKDCCRSLRFKQPLLPWSIFRNSFLMSASLSFSVGSPSMILTKAAKSMPPRQSSSYSAMMLQTVYLVALKPLWKRATLRSLGLRSPALLESQESKASLMAVMSYSLNLEVMQRLGLNSAGSFRREITERPGLLVISLNLLPSWIFLMGVILDLIVTSLKLYQQFKRARQSQLWMIDVLSELNLLYVYEIRGGNDCLLK